MAGLTLGARSPAASSPLPSPAQRTLRRAPAASSRTRFNHGVFQVGDELATVCSSRRQDDGLGVLLQLGHGALMLSGAMTPAQARLMAKALMAASHAAEAAQAGAGQRQQEGGAA